MPNRATQMRAQAMAEALLAEQLSPEQLEELMPLQVMLRVMRSAYQAGNHQLAYAAAEGCAPYLHAKLSSSDVRITGDTASKSDEAIEAERLEILAKMAAAAKDEAEPQLRIVA